MSRARYAPSILLFALALAGCGQSGPLYLPGNPSQMTAPTAEPVEAGEEQSEEADDGDRE